MRSWLLIAVFGILPSSAPTRWRDDVIYEQTAEAGQPGSSNTCMSLGGPVELARRAPGSLRDAFGELGAIETLPQIAHVAENALGGGPMKKGGNLGQLGADRSGHVAGRVAADP